MVFVCWFAGNPLEGIQKELTRPYGNSTKLLEFLQARGVNSRLSGVIVSGLVEDGKRSDWSDFLTRGYADPRLFLWIHAFAFDSSTLTAEEDSDSGSTKTLTLNLKLNSFESISLCLWSCW